MHSYCFTLIFALIILNIQAQTEDSLVQVYSSDTLIEFVNYLLPRIEVNQKKKVRADPSYYKGPIVIDGVYEKVITVCRPEYTKFIKVIYKNRIGDIYKIREFCGTNFYEKTMHFYANGHKKYEEMYTEDCTCYKTYLIDGSLGRFYLKCENEQGDYTEESKDERMHRLETEDSTLIIHYYENGNINSREVRASEKQHTDFWDEDAYYIGANFYLAADSFKIRHDISIEGDTTVLEGWMRLNPISLQEEYFKNE